MSAVDIAGDTEETPKTRASASAASIAESVLR